MKTGEIPPSPHRTFQPVAPRGLGPGATAFLVLLLLVAGEYFAVRNEPNFKDLLSDLGVPSDSPPSKSPGSASPTAPPVATPPEYGPLDGDGKRIRRQLDTLEADMRRRLAEARNEMAREAADKPSPPPLLLGVPDCTPFGRQWIVSGQVLNPRTRPAAAAKAIITLWLDGEAAETQEIEIGPVPPLGTRDYKVLFRTGRETRPGDAWAEAAWKDPS